MTIRHATDADEPAIQLLWREFVAESPPPAYLGESDDLELGHGGTTAWVGERFGGVVAFARARPIGTAVEIVDLYVARAHRRHGLGKTLIGAALAEWPDATHVRLEAALAALPFYNRLGFQEEARRLEMPAPALRARLAQREKGESFGSIHVQTDDQGAVERAVRQFVPRLPGGSRGSIVAPPRNGWIAVYDDVCDRDPRQLRRLAKELGDRMGSVVLVLAVEEAAVTRFVLFEHGKVVDEYLSIQEYYGPLPPGDVVALAANPRVVSRLTGSDAGAVRAAAVHGASPGELPAAAEVLVSIARAIGVEGAEHGWSDAPTLAGAVVVER